MKNLFSGKRTKRLSILIPSKLLPIILELLGINKSIKGFAFQLEDLPLYITYRYYSKHNNTLTIYEPDTHNSKTIKIDLHDSITSLFFVLNVIKEEYRQKILFTTKSELY